MKKAVSYAIGTVVLVGAGYAGASWYAGNQITEALDNSANALKEYPMIKISNRTMEKGLIQSVENVTYQVGCGAKPDFSVTLKNTIHHQAFNTNMETAIQYDDKTRAEYKAIFKDQEPLSIRTTFGVGGKFNTQLSSPKFVFEKDGGRMESQGLNLNIESDKTASFANLLFDMGGVTFSAPNKLALTVGKISYQGNVTLSSNGTYVGTTKGEMASLSLNDFSTGKIGFSTSETAEGTFQNAHMKTNIDNIVFKAKPLGTLTSNMQMNRIDAKAIADLNALQILNAKRMLQCNFAPDEVSLAKIQSAISALLEKDPELKFTVDMASDLGASQLTASFNSKGLTAKDLTTDVQNFNVWKSKIQASIAFQTPLAFVENLLTLVTLETDSADKDTALSQLHQQLDDASKLGFIVQDGKTIKFDAALTQGAATLNGKPFNKF